MALPVQIDTEQATTCQAATVAQADQVITEGQVATVAQADQVITEGQVATVDRAVIPNYLTKKMVTKLNKHLKAVAIDMWPAYISAVKHWCPQAAIVFDRFTSPLPV